MRPPVVAATALAVALLAASVAYAGQGTDPPSAHATPAFSILATLGGYPVETLKTGNAWRGRQSPLAASGYVGLPYVLANFQGYFKCDPAVKIGRPTTFQELIDLVKTFPRVKAVGVGHSWWQQQFCAGTEPTALGLVLTEFPSVLKSYVLTPDAYPLATSPRGFGYGVGDVPWKLDDVLAPTTVTVLAGAGTRALLDWLAQQKPTPLTLPAFPWYIDQTIGGAVATATHGSSLQYGSLSQQVTAIELVLADGSVRTFTPADDFIFQAAVASVGRLGVVTKLTLRVVPAVPVRRSVVKESWDAMVAEISGAAAGYTAAIAANDPAAATAALAPLSEVDYFPYIPLRTAWKVNYTRLDPSADVKAATIIDAAAAAKAAAADAAREVRAYVADTKGAAAAAALDAWIADRDAAADGLLSKLNTTGVLKGAPTLDTVAVAALPGHHLGKGYPAREAEIYGVAAALDAATASNNPPGAYDQWPKSVAVPPAPLYKYDWCDHRTWSSIFSIAMGVNLRPGVYSARAAYASQSAVPSVLLSDINPYDQYEANIPMSRVPGCLAAVTDVLYGPTNAAAGFRTTPLIRFSSPDDALISPANRPEPSMYFNLEDHVSYDTPGEPNAGFDAVISTLIHNPACGGRLHWGKAGWPRLLPDFDGAAAPNGYPATWCQFGCAVNALDPGGKFASTWGGWSWTAVSPPGSASYVPNFGAACCTGPGGAFNAAACACAPRPAAPGRK